MGMEQKIPPLDELLATKDAWQQAQREGVDVHLLWDNLNRSVPERIRRHQAALNTMLKLQKANQQRQPPENSSSKPHWTAFILRV